jgi:molybdopterin-guanine dinucleotide biosynthesis protein A
VHSTVGIVLVGGRSSRMGTSKALLEWHGSTLVRRVAGIVARGVGGPVVVVRAPGQPLPRLPGSFEVVDDVAEGKGPLGGLSVGLAAFAHRGTIAYVSSTDAPFLHPAFVRRVLSEVGDGVDAAVPYVRGYRQPLAAAYRVSLGPLVESLVAANELRASSLLDACRWIPLDQAALLSDADVARFDPELDSVTNLNDPTEYAAARSLAAPEVYVECAGALRAPGCPERLWIRATTLGSAAEAVGVSLAAHVVASLNGDQVSPDPDEPLARGDVVSLTSAEPDARALRRRARGAGGETYPAS